MPDKWWKKLQIATYHQERQEKLYEEFQWDLKEIELTKYRGDRGYPVKIPGYKDNNDYKKCVDNLWDRAHDWKAGNPNPTLNEDEKSKLWALLAPQRIEIKKYTKERYGENWKAKYDWLCKVAEARLEESIIQDVIDSRTLTLNPSNTPMLTQKSKEILETWDKKWADRDGLSKFDAKKLTPERRYAFHATFAYLEATVGAFQIHRDCGLKTEFLPMPPESNKAQTEDEDRPLMQSRLILPLSTTTGRIVGYTNDIVFVPDKLAVVDIAKMETSNGFYSFTGKVIDSALHMLAHEYYHKTADAIAWKLYYKINPIGNNQRTFFRYRDFVHRKLGRAIWKIAENKLAYELKAGIRMTEKGRDTQGVSIRATDSPGELVAEQGSSRALTPPDERNAPTQAVDELFKYGADAVADALYAYLNTKKGQEEFDGHKKYFEDGYKFNTKKIPAEIAKEYEWIQNSNIKKAVKDDYLHLARFATTYATYHAELKRWKTALASLKKSQDDGTLNEQLSTQKTALKKNNKFVKYRQQYDWDTTDVKNKIEQFAAANLLSGLKPPRDEEKQESEWWDLYKENRKRQLNPMEAKLTTPPELPEKTGFLATLRRWITGSSLSREEEQAALDQRKDEIMKYTQKEYGTAWKPEYTRLCRELGAKFERKTVLKKRKQMLGLCKIIWGPEASQESTEILKQLEDLDNIKIPFDTGGTLVYLEQIFGANQIMKNCLILDEKQKAYMAEQSLQTLADGADRDTAIARYSRLLTEAITWSLYIERNPALIKQASGPIVPKAEFQRLRGFVEQKLAEAIGQVASEKGSNIVKSNSSELIAEAVKGMALVKPDNRNALGQAMYELFKNGFRPVVNELHEYMKSDQGKKEYDNYMPIPQTLPGTIKENTNTVNASIPNVLSGSSMKK